MQRSVNTTDLVKVCARQANEAKLIQKTVKPAPFRAAQQEVIFEEDFSKLTGGTEAEPGAEIGSYTVDQNSAWPDDVTSTPGWWGIGTYAIDGALGLCFPGHGGVVSTGPMNMYGNLHVSFRAKAREGNKVGSSQVLIVSITKGDKYSPVMAAAEGYQPVYLKVEDGWQDVELTFRNPNKGDDSCLQINGMTYSKAGFVIDDIKITRDYDFCLPPESMSCGNFTDDGFTVSWTPGAENNSYQLWLVQEKKLSEIFDATEDFEGALPQYWSTTGSTVADEGADNSKALRLENGQKLTLAFGGGRLASLETFMRSVNLPEGSQAVISVYGTVDGEELDLAKIAVPELKAEGEELNLLNVLSDYIYQVDNLRLVAEGFEDGAYCIIDNMIYKASPACERTRIINGKPVEDTQFTFTDLDPENEYFVGIKGVKNEHLSSDFLGYFYVPGMPAPKVTEATDIEKRGAYTAHWTPSPKALSYTVNNYKINTIAEDQKDYVVLHEDFAKADDAVQAEVNTLYFDEWSDNKGWHTDKLPNNFSTLSTADAGYIGTIGLPIHSPVVSLNNGDGKFTVRFKVKAFGGELISVYSGEQVQYYDFAEVNPNGDYYSFEEHEVEMQFDNGTAAHNIIFASRDYTMLLDWVEITQDVKAGDKVLRFESMTDLIGHDSSEYRFTGLQNAPDITYAYNVIAYGEYMGTKFNSMPSESMEVDLNAAGVGMLNADKGVLGVAGVRGGIALSLSQAAQVDIFSVAGLHVTDVNAAQGTTFINLPAGFYVVKIGEHTFKVIVK